MTNRQLTLVVAAGYKTRTETYDGREHLVVPVVALVEGVVHAMNAANAELVTAEEYTKTVSGWNGRPVFLGHPMISGQPVSGNTPTVTEKRIGIIFNSALKKGKLTMEAWLDVERCQEQAPTLLERIAEDDPIEISVGVFTDTDETAGDYKGKKYLGVWHDIMPDHLALLPEGDLGACSRSAGCGVRAAKEGSMEPKKSQKNATSLLSRVMSMFRGGQAATDMSDNDVRRKITDALREVEPNVSYVEAVYDDLFVYCVYFYGPSTSGMEYFQRGYKLAEDGTVTIDASRTEVEPVLYYEPVEKEAEPVVAGTKPAATPVVASEGTVAGAPCSCQSRNNSAPKTETEMKKEELVAFLEKATPEQMKALEAAVEGKTPVAEVPVVAAAPKVATKDDVLTADEKEALAEGLKVAGEKRTASIKALKDTKRCPYSDEELGKMSQAELNRLVALVGTEVKPAVDFGAQGAPKVAGQEPTEAPAPIDLGASIRASRGQK